jgi:hypothetical protein
MIKLTRAVLYKLVWSYPMTEIAKHYGVRDLQIAKACDLNNIARPPAGYWQRLAYGKNVEKTDLQTVNFSAEDTVTIERSGARAPWRRTQQDAKNLGQTDDGRPGESRNKAEL